MSSEGFSGRGAPVTSEEFRRACGRFATGVAIAGVVDARGTPHGLTVSSFTSVSLDPPLVLICLGHAVSAIQHFRSATHFAINLLTADQRALSERFAQRGHDRFDGVPWEPGASGAPLIPGALAAIECAVHRIVPMGDHDILVGEVVRTQVNAQVDTQDNGGGPLLHFAGGYRKL